MAFRSKLKVQISFENLLFSVVSVFEGVTKTKVEIIPIKVSSDKSLCYYKFFWVFAYCLGSVAEAICSSSIPIVK